MAVRVCVSACLLGERCKYDGGSNLVEGLAERLAAEGAEVLPVCPEVVGGLSVPRPPAELHRGRVVTAAGEDVTAAFERGVERCLAQIDAAGGVEAAILQPRSPSCGVTQIYDGTFTGHLIPASGLFAQALRARAIPTAEP